MKFLLAAVNAKYIHSNPAIYSLRAYAGKELPLHPQKQLGKHIRLAEYTINQSMQDILADIYSHKPDAVGFSCYIWNWTLVQELITELPKLLPDTDIWLGGPQVSYDGERILARYPQVSGIMVGEGEATFRELLEIYTETEGAAYAGNFSAGEAVEMPGRHAGSSLPGRFQSCAGLYLPTGPTAPRELIDMSDIPFLYEDLEPFANRIIYYETSRGCPYRCSYCLSSIDKSVRFRDISVVKKELQFFLDNRVKQVKFVDRTFNCKHEHAMEIWKYLKENDNGVTNFHFEITADILREEEILLLNQMRPGLVQLEIGVQSVNPDTISAIQRVMNVDRLEGIVSAIRRGNNIHQHLDLIAGLPFEDYESFGKSFDRVYRMKPQQLQLGFLKVLKGSAMEEKAAEYGLCCLDRPPYEVLYTNWLSYEEVLRLKRIEEMVEMYYNSSQYTHTLSFLENAFEGPFAMFEAMAAYFQEKGYFLNSPARVYRYEILLDFAGEKDGQHLPVYRELLTFDLYLRENAKSRPAFAKDLKDDKKEMRDFYKKEEQDRQYLPDYKQYDWKQMEKMTHMESFCYPVWDAQKLRESFLQEVCVRRDLRQEVHRHSEKTFVLFDYRKRSPLTYEAETYRIKRQERHGYDDPKLCGN